MTEAFFRLWPAVRRSERGRFLFFAGLSALLTLAHTVGLAGSEALFLAEIGAARLPETFILASLATVTASLAYSLVVGRARNDRLFVVMLSGAGALLLAAGALLRLHRGEIIVALFCAAYIVQAVFLSVHFWTFAADYFDTLASKRLFPYFAVGASVGGVAGGALAVLLGRVADTESLVFGWGAALLAAAVCVRLARNNLRRWTPVGVDELDESSVGGVLSALRFVQRSPLARWLMISVIGMVFSLFLMQYVYMDVFQRSFPSAKELATFIGLYLGVTNALEIAVARGLTPFLISRFGVAQANLAHPLLMLSTFGALAIHPVLSVAVLARASREMMENAVASPIRSLSYNGLPYRFRGRIRLFLEGLVFFGSMSVAGIALLLLGSDLGLFWLCLVGTGSALLYVGANAIVRREYLRSLIEGIRTGRLELDLIDSQLGGSELASFAEHWDSLLASEVASEASRPSRNLLQLAPLLAQRGFREPVRKGLDHVHPLVRAACVEALSEVGDDGRATFLPAALSDPDAGVRLAAARAAEHVESMEPILERALAGLLHDEDPRVRAESALRLGAPGLATLAEMTRGPDPRSAVEALDRIPPDLIEIAEGRLGDPDPAIRSAALSCIARIPPLEPVSTSRLLEDLDHSDPRVRRAAASVLARRPDLEHAEALARCLDDVSRAVRDEAQSALASLGDLGVQVARPYVDLPRRWTADAALAAIAGAATPSARPILEGAYRDRVHDAWKTAISLDLLADDDTLPARFLRTAMDNAHGRNCWLAFRILELLEDRAVVRSVRKTLDYASSRMRSDALEVLSNLGEREASDLFALLLEEGPLSDKLAGVVGVLATPRGSDEVLRYAERSHDRWLMLAADGCRAGDAQPANLETRTMERLLALRNVHLFAHLSLEQIEAINQSMEEAQYVPGEIVCRQGDPGEVLYVILEGVVEAYKDYETPRQHRLNTMMPPGYFGEIAILDSAPRSATCVVTRDARLLTLAGDRFKELILQTPEMSFEIFRELTGRVRAAEERATPSAE